MKSTMTTTLIVAIIVAAAAFFGGMQYQKSQGRSNFANGGQFGQRQTGAQARGGRGAGGATMGEILSVDDKSMTVKLQDGSSKIINIASSTTFSKTTTGAKTDLKTGVRVAAFGTSNSDGSLTAQNVQLNPMFRTGGQGKGMQTTPTQ